MVAAPLRTSLTQVGLVGPNVRLVDDCDATADPRVGERFVLTADGTLQVSGSDSIVRCASAEHGERSP